MKSLNKIITILLLCTLISCGARKVIKTEVDIEQKTTSTTKDTTSIKEEKTTTLKDTTSTIEEEYIPIDSTQPMIINKTKGIYKNVKFKTRKIKNGIGVSIKENKATQASNTSNNKTITNIKEDIKESDRETNLPWWFWLIIAGVIFLFLFLEYKRR